jgi:cell wall-associated NlpC family hydrolase
LRLRQIGTRAPLTAIALAVAALASPSAALGAGGGLAPTNGAEDGTQATPTTPTPASTECAPTVGGISTATCAPVKKARLVRGAAVPPRRAPEAVKAAISAANRIRTRPYIWGGGHARWWMAGYDCSGAVGFALHGAGLIEASMDSGEMMHWGVPGKGRWITVYANPGHAFAVIDGLRWDTAGDAHGTGPRWHRNMVSTAGFVARHPLGY